MLVLRRLLVAFCVVLSGVSYALTPGERVVLFSGIRPVWQANFLSPVLVASQTLPAGLTYSKSGSIPATLFDSTGKLTYQGNNLLTYSNTFSTGWSFSSVTVSNPNAVSDPFGGTNATTITATANAAQLYQYLAISSAASTNYVTSIWVKRRSGSGNIRIFNPNSTTTVIPVTSTWTKFSSSGAGGAGFIYPGILIATNGDAVDVYAATASAVTYETTPRSQDQIITTSTAYYGPRFDYDPSTLAPRGLLVEEPRVQYAQYSQNFGTGWTSPGGATTITTASGVTSPDGTSQMALLTQTNTSGLIYGNSTGLTTTGTNYVSSGYFKAGASSPAPYFEIAFTDVSGSYAIAYFNSSTGAYVTSAAARGSIVSYGSTLISNGIWRCWVVASFTTITTGLRSLLNVASDTSGNTVAGQTGYVWGAQVEAGSFPTSYIPNPTSSTVTRTADVVQFNGVPLAALRKTPLTLAVEAQIPYPINNYAIVGSAGVGSPVDLLAVNNGLQTNALVYDSTAGNVSVSNGSANWSSIARAVMATSAAGSSVDISGGTVATTSTPLGTNRTSYNFGLMERDNGANQLSGWVRSAAIYNQRLPDAKLKSLSVVGAPW